MAASRDRGNGPKCVADLHRKRLEHAAFQSEALVIIFEMVAQHIEESKPRPRGRPRKEVS